MKDTTLTLSTRNCFLREEIIALGRFWRKIYKATRPGKGFDPVIAKQYEELADGLEAVHTILLTCTEDFRNAWKAAWYCYNKVVKELQFMPRNDVERPGFEAAQKLFNKRLRGTK